MTYHFAVKTDQGESLTPGESKETSDFVTVYNFYGLVDGSAKSPEGWEFSSESRAPQIHPRNPPPQSRSRGPLPPQGPPKAGPPGPETGTEPPPARAATRSQRRRHTEPPARAAGDLAASDRAATRCQGRRPRTRPGAARAPGAPGTLRGLKQKLFGPPFSHLVSTRPRGVPAGAERGAGGAELRGRPQPPGLRKNSRRPPTSSRAPQIPPASPKPRTAAAPSRAPGPSRHPPAPGLRRAFSLTFRVGLYPLLGWCRAPRRPATARATTGNK
jgi:hypothetical protein